MELRLLKPVREQLVLAARDGEYGEYIEAESSRSFRIVDNILDFSRIESGLER